MTTTVLERLLAAENCQPCVHNAGLCVSCAEGDRSILPQLKRPSWVRLIGDWPKPVDVDSEAAKIASRKWRKRMRRLGRALTGEFTSSRPSAA